MTVLIFHVSRQFKYHVTFWVGSFHSNSATYQVLRAMDLVNVEIKYFYLTREHVINDFVSRDFVG